MRLSGNGGPGLNRNRAVSNGSAPPARTGAIDLLPNESTPHCAAGDPASGLAWFGTSTQPGNVVLTSYSQKGFIKGTRLVLTESAAVTNVHFYSHRATGRLRLALYEGSNNWITTSERWASYVSYDVPPPEFTQIRVTGDMVTLEWLSNPGTSYQVQRCSVLLPLPVWTDVGAPTQAMGTTTLWSEPGAVGTAARFYRLELR